MSLTHSWQMCPIHTGRTFQSIFSSPSHAFFIDTIFLRTQYSTSKSLSNINIIQSINYVTFAPNNTDRLANGKQANTLNTQINIAASYTASMCTQISLLLGVGWLTLFFSSSHSLLIWFRDFHGKIINYHAFHQFQQTYIFRRILCTSNCKIGNGK